MKRMILISLAVSALVACDKKKERAVDEPAPDEVASEPDEPTPAEEAPAQEEAPAPTPSFAASKKDALRAAFDAGTANDVEAWRRLMPTAKMLDEMCPSHGVELPPLEEIEEGALGCKEAFKGRLEEAAKDLDTSRWGLPQEGELDKERGAKCEGFEVYTFHSYTYEIRDENGIMQFGFNFPTLFHHDGEWGILDAPRCGVIAPG